MHDQNFKNLIIDYPQAALAFFAQEEAGAGLNQARIIPIRQEQLKERLGERFRELDTPLLVEWPDGERAALLFVIEEETQTYRFSIHRLAHYCLDMAELMKTERVIPVVIFLNTGLRQQALHLGGDRQNYLEFSYLACDLKRLSAHDYQDSDNIIARLNLPNMQYSQQERLQIYHAAHQGLLTLEPDINKQSKYLDFIDYYADLSNEEIIEYRTHYLTEEDDMGLAQLLRQEGRQEGKQEGWQEGKHEECILLATRVLRRKFGIQPVVEQALPQLPALPVTIVEELIESALDWTNASDFSDWLNRQLQSHAGANTDHQQR